MQKIYLKYTVGPSVYIPVKKRYLPFGEGLAQGLDDTTIKAKYSINFSRSKRTFILSLNLNGNNTFLIC